MLWVFSAIVIRNDVIARFASLLSKRGYTCDDRSCVIESLTKEVPNVLLSSDTLHPHTKQRTTLILHEPEPATKQLQSSNAKLIEYHTIAVSLRFIYGISLQDCMLLWTSGDTRKEIRRDSDPSFLAMVGLWYPGTFRHFACCVVDRWEIHVWHLDFWGAAYRALSSLLHELLHTIILIVMNTTTGNWQALRFVK